MKLTWLTVVALTVRIQSICRLSLNLHIRVLKVLFKGLEYLLKLFFSVVDACHAQTVDQVAHSASNDLTTFALIKFLLLDLLH
jgi:hypothetical protein